MERSFLGPLPAWPLFVFLAAAATCCALLTPTGVASAAVSGKPPNVLLIMTDDQRQDGTTDAVMPRTKRLFGTYGTTFPEGYVTTPLCCPARSSFYSGRYVHNHGVYNNSVSPNYDHSATLQRYLHDAGYLTGIMGKFLNEWNIWFPPPYFDRYAINGDGSWLTSNDNAYFPTVNENGQIRSLGEGTPYYYTHYLRDRAADFIAQAERDDDQPWFLVVTPVAPHLPSTAEAKYESAAVPAQDTHESYYEADLSDKPAWVRSLPTQPANVELLRQKMLRTLMSVDEMVSRIFQELQRRGEDENTLAFYTSDNGFLWGEHGMREKGRPYTESIKVPFYARWPNQRRLFGRGAVDDRIVTDIDIAPTALDAAGVTVPVGAPPMDGVSLLDKATRRDHLLTEFYSFGERNKVIPPWASLRTTTYHYIEYYQEDGTTPLQWGDGSPVREYYDLVNDPYEVTNLLHDGDPLNDPPTAGLSLDLERERLCSGSNCHPGTGSPTLVDTTAPKVDVALPPDGASLADTGLMKAIANDNVGIAGVQFQLDGIAAGAEDAATPYEVNLDTTLYPDGQHSLTAVARDAHGNVAVSTPVPIAIDNASASPIDVQTCPPSPTCGPTLGGPENGDKLTYYYDAALQPDSFLSDWNGEPQAITVDINADDPALDYHDTVTVAGVPALGTVDMNRNDFVRWYEGNSYPASTIEMAADGKSITVTLGGGLPGLDVSISDRMNWTAGAGGLDTIGRPVCGCFVTESGTRDNDF